MADLTIYDGDNISEFTDVNLHSALRDYFGEFPKGAMLFESECSLETNITPKTQEDIESIDADNGQYYVMNGFGDPLTAIAVVGAIVSIATSVVSIFLRPDIPSLDNQQVGSANNSLSDRRNRLRPNGRILDSFGRNRVIPDLVALPLRTFIDNREVETSLLCLGRGSYDIEEVRDGTTRIDDIGLASACIFGPFTSPNFGSPQLHIGSQIVEGVTNNRQLRAVNGQTLVPPGSTSGSENGVNYTVFASFNTSSANGTLSFLSSLSGLFSAGDIIDISNSDIDGQYTVSSVTAFTLVLSDVSTVNSAWITVNNNNTPIGVTITSGLFVPQLIIGPFDTRLSGANTWVCNFIAPNGVFRTGEDGQEARSVRVRVTLTPIDPSGADIGPSETFSTVLVGSSENRDRIGVTLYCTPTFTGFARIEAERVTPADNAFEGTVSDQIIWRDVFFTSPVEQDHFGNVTLIHSRTIATAQTSAIADRELNVLCTRRVPTRIAGTNTFTAPQATERADDIIVAMATDEYIGRLSMADIDLDSIYGSVQRLEDYYGAEEAVRFGAIFDDDNLSIQETLDIVGNTIGGQFYRIGSQLKLFPIIETDEAAGVFNHRNKTPASDVIRDSFGERSDVDGIRMQYVDDIEFMTQQFNIPELETARAPRSVSGFGVSNTLQAYHLAWRARNSDTYQVGSHDFEAMPEAQLLIRGQNIVVADNTRASTQDGEIVSINGLVLTLSQPVNLTAGVGYSIQIQNSNMTVEVVPLTVPASGYQGFQVTLSRPLSRALFLQPDGVFKPPYTVTSSDGSRVRTCRVARVNPNNQGISRVETSVYTPLVHSNDGITLWLRDGLEDFGPFIFSAGASNVNEVAEVSGRENIIQFEAGGVLNPAVQQTASYTFMTWVLTGVGQEINIKSTPNGSITFTASGSVIFQHQGSVFTGRYGVGQWIHVATSYDADANIFSAFIDGVEIASEVVTGDDIGTLTLGSASSEYFMDDVRLYRRTLTSAGISALHAATRV